MPVVRRRRLADSNAPVSWQWRNRVADAATASAGASQRRPAPLGLSAQSRYMIRACAYAANATAGSLRAVLIFLHWELARSCVDWNFSCMLPGGELDWRGGC